MPPPIRILIVSSELHNRCALADILNREHWQTICASTVNQCREVLARRNVTLVFCERQLPDGTYCDVLNFIRSSNVNVPVVVTSRLADWNEYFEVLNEGGFDLIATPCYATEAIRVARRAQQGSDTREAFIEHGAARASPPLERALRGQVRSRGIDLATMTYEQK